MPVQDDIAAIVVQESTLTLPGFTPDTAWQLGTMLRDLAIARKYALVIDVRRFGAPHQQLFYCALAGTTPDNQRWVMRKINTVARFHKSSYHVGRLLEAMGPELDHTLVLFTSDHGEYGASHGLRGKGAGDRHTLLLSAGQCPPQRVRPVPQYREQAKLLINVGGGL